MTVAAMALVLSACNEQATVNKQTIAPDIETTVSIQKPVSILANDAPYIKNHSPIRRRSDWDRKKYFKTECLKSSAPKLKATLFIEHKDINKYCECVAKWGDVQTDTSGNYAFVLAYHELNVVSKHLTQGYSQTKANRFFINRVEKHETKYNESHGISAKGLMSRITPIMEGMSDCYDTTKPTNLPYLEQTEKQQVESLEYFSDLMRESVRSNKRFVDSWSADANLDLITSTKTLNKTATDDQIEKLQTLNKQHNQDNCESLYSPLVLSEGIGFRAVVKDKDGTLLYHSTCLGGTQKSPSTPKLRGSKT